MSLISRLFLSICSALACLAPALVQAQATVFAAASLQGALDEVVAASELDIVVSYGGSGLMARQVTQGAPADVIILANAAWMEWLEAQGAVEPGSTEIILSNTLVLVGPTGAEPLPTADADALLARLDGERLALGQTEAVPAGIYAREWMQNTGIWAALRPYLAETENVRAALALVARKEAPLGVVYQSDADAEAGVDVVHRIDADGHSPIVYLAAIVQGRARDDVTGFQTFLRSETAQDIFAAHGFLRAGHAQ